MRVKPFFDCWIICITFAAMCYIAYIINITYRIMSKTALITGVTGQDGSFLSEFLLEKGYDVHGTIRRSSVDF